MSKFHFFSIFCVYIYATLLCSFIRTEILHQFRKFLFSFKFRRKCTIWITHYVFNVYDTRLFGKFFMELEDWISLRCSRKETMRFWNTEGLYNITKKFVEGFSKLFTIWMINSFSINVILSLDVITFEKRGTTFSKNF